MTMRSAERHLLSRLGHALEVHLAGDGIDDTDQRLQMKFAAERAVGGEGLQHRAGIGEPGGLDDHPHKARHGAAGAVGEQSSQGLLQIAANITAQTPIAEQHGRVAARAQQHIVDADLAIFVDDDRGAGTLGLVGQRADQGRLAGAEKTGHREDREPCSPRPPLAPAE